MQDRNGARDGDSVIVEITKRPQGESAAQGRIVEVLQDLKPSDLAADSRSATIRRKTAPPEALQAASRLRANRARIADRAARSRALSLAAPRRCDLRSGLTLRALGDFDNDAVAVARAMRSCMGTSMHTNGRGPRVSTCPLSYPDFHKPPMRFGESPMRRIKRAMRRPRSFIPTASTSTRSLCISVGVSARASTRGAEASSGKICTSPLLRPADPACHALTLARRRKAVGSFEGLAVANHGRQAFGQRILLGAPFKPNRFASRAAVKGSGASARCFRMSSRLAMGSA